MPTRPLSWSAARRSAYALRPGRSGTSQYGVSKKAKSMSPAGTKSRISIVCVPGTRARLKSSSVTTTNRPFSYS